MRLRQVFLCVPATALALLAWSGANARKRVSGPRYTIQDLGALHGGHSYAFGINNNGQVVGYSYNEAGVQRAFLWQNGAMADIGPANDRYSDPGSEARAISDSGAIAGRDHYDPVVWSNGGMARLPVTRTRDSLDNLALDVNDSGQMAGSIFHFVRRAVLWADSRTPIFLDPTGDRTDASVAGALNNPGQVIVHGQGGSYLWHDGKFTPLGFAAADINDVGQIVGMKNNAAVLWQNGKLTQIGQTNSSAIAIADNGQVIGTWRRKPAVWHQGSIFTLQSRLIRGAGWKLQNVTAINDPGQIVGWGRYRRRTRAFVLTPQ